MVNTNCKVSNGVQINDDPGATLAGLGDVAVPGLLACLALRFDAVRLLQPGQAAGTETSAQVRPMHVIHFSVVAAFQQLAPPYHSSELHVQCMHMHMKLLGKQTLNSGVLFQEMQRDCLMKPGRVLWTYRKQGE